MNNEMSALRKSTVALVTAGAVSLLPLNSQAWWEYQDRINECSCGCGETWNYVLHYPEEADRDPETGLMPDAYSTIDGCEQNICTHS